MVSDLFWAWTQVLKSMYKALVPSTLDKLLSDFIEGICGRDKGAEKAMCSDLFWVTRFPANKGDSARRYHCHWKAWSP